MFGYGSGAGFGLDSPTTPEGGDVDGVYPFTTNSNNPSNPNNATWWNRRTAFFASAAAHGFYVICNITTPNLNSTVFTNTWTTTQWTDWGTKLAAAFASTSNILWIAADDYFGTIDSNLNALLASMRTGGCNQPVGIQWYQETSCRKDIFNGTDLTTNNNWARDAQYNFGYSYNVWYDVVEKMGNEVNPVPHFAADGTFLNTGGITSITDKQLMRRQVWWALSSGSKGFQVGDNNVWTWASTALAEVTTNTFYTSVVPAISTYFRSLPNWHRCSPTPRASSSPPAAAPTPRRWCPAARAASTSQLRLLRHGLPYRGRHARRHLHVARVDHHHRRVEDGRRVHRDLGGPEDLRHLRGNPGTDVQLDRQGHQLRRRGRLGAGARGPHRRVQCDRHSR
jgi:hypothetical protein